MRYQSLSQSGFINELKDSSEGPHPCKFCFVLGAGASRSSGIKMGQELVDCWEAELINRNPEDYQNWKRENGITDANKYAKYSLFYEKRFQMRPLEGLNFLEKNMENKTPGIGYVILSYILTHTRHNVVITTNFDHLLEDSITYYTDKIPMVIGHEKLARYISPDLNRPLIIKLHRDLLFEPRNTSEDIAALSHEWKEQLNEIFTEYHPVFIGYAGNDGSLMDYLIYNSHKFNTDEWKFPYWTLYKSDTPEGMVNTFLSQTRSYCINSSGFDTLLCLIGIELGYHLPSKEDFINNAEQRYSRLIENFLQAASEISSEPTPDHEQDTTDLQKTLRNTVSSDAAVVQSMTADLLFAKKDYKNALKIQEKLIQEFPDNALYQNNIGTTYHEMQDYPNAKIHKINAVALAPYNASFHNNLGTTYHELKDYENAIKEKSLAVKLDSANAEYHDSLAVTLYKSGHLKKALSHAETAIKLEPDNKSFLANHAKILEKTISLNFPENIDVP